ncbi:MAG: hypothetical protein K6U14_12345, partial [Firmicutes bacterium]|nr:hypothetical protein [Alicyclobacillaceae bacterium]MCL6498400.1 hypothetical protein [Bacillota bacterium]
GLEPADPAAAFVAALGRAAVAIAEAEANWVEHPDAIDALVGVAQYPEALPSFAEFARDFLAWVEAVADREAALRDESQQVVLYSYEEGRSPAHRRMPPAAGPRLGREDRPSPHRATPGPRVGSASICGAGAVGMAGSGGIGACGATPPGLSGRRWRRSSTG